MLSARQIAGEQGGLEAAELFGGQEVANDDIAIGKEARLDDEAVAIELIAQRCGQVLRQSRAAPVGEGVRGAFAPHVQPGAVEPRRGKDRIVEKALCAGQDRERPPWRAPPAQDAAKSVVARHVGHDTKRAPIAAT